MENLTPSGPVGENSNRWQMLILVGGLAAICLLSVFGAGVYLMQTRPELAAQVGSLIPPTATPLPTVTRTRVPEPTSTPQPRATEIPPPTEAPTQNTTATARAERTAEAIATTQAERAITAALAAQAEWPVVIADDFSTTNPRGWEVGVKEDEYLSVTTKLTGEAYRWQTTVAQNFAYFNFLPESGEEFADFYARVNVRFVRGVDDDSYAYGLVFRNVDEDYGFFGITPNGGVRILMIYGGLNLIESSSDAIRPGDVNEIAVSAIGEDFVFFINGVVAYTLTDDSLTSGQIGLSVDGLNPGGESVVEFSELEIRAAP